jgi:thioredoxin 1
MAEFIELNDENFKGTLENQAFAIVDYYASWCGACRLAAGMFLRVADACGSPIFKIDAEKNVESRQGVEISNLPTLAVFINGICAGSLCTTKEDSLREFLQSHGAQFKD